MSQHAKEDMRYFVEGYRILPEWDAARHDYGAFTVELVQTIYFPAMSDENALGNINMVIDHEERKMYTYSRNNNANRPNSGKCIITCFDVPDVSAETIYLDDSDIRDAFYLDCSAANMQGGCIRNGMLYIAQGAKRVGYIYMNILDLRERQLTARLDLLKAGFSLEPEGCFLYKNDIFFGAETYLYQLILK